MVADITYSYGTKKAEARAQALALETFGQKIIRHARRIVLEGNITTADILIMSGLCGMVLGFGVVLSLHINY